MKKINGKNENVLQKIGMWLYSHSLSEEMQVRQGIEGLIAIERIRSVRLIENYSMKLYVRFRHI